MALLPSWVMLMKSLLLFPSVEINAEAGASSNGESYQWKYSVLIKYKRHTIKIHNSGCNAVIKQHKQRCTEQHVRVPVEAKHWKNCTCESNLPCRQGSEQVWRTTTWDTEPCNDLCSILCRHPPANNLPSFQVCQAPIVWILFLCFWLARAGEFHPFQRLLMALKMMVLLCCCRIAFRKAMAQPDSFPLSAFSSDLMSTYLLAAMFLFARNMSCTWTLELSAMLGNNVPVGRNNLLRVALREH